MKIELTEIRAINRMSGYQLRRARRLYIRLIYTSCLADESGITINRCVLNAKARLLYAEKSHPKDIRWSFLRRFWRLTEGYEDFRGWFRWMEDHGLRQCRFDKNVFNTKAA